MEGGRDMESSENDPINDWIERETLKRKVLGFNYLEIAEAIGQAGRREDSSIVPLPEGVEFPTDFHISPEDAAQACWRALEKLPSTPPHLARKLFSHQLGEMFLLLQAKMRKGDAKSVDAGRRLLTQDALINGYNEPPPIELEPDSNPDEDAESDEEILRALTDEEAQAVGATMARARRRVKNRKNEKLYGDQNPALLNSDEDESPPPRLPLPVSPSSRQLVLEFLYEPPQISFPADEIARGLWTDLAQTLAVLDSLQMCGLVVHEVASGVDKWGCAPQFDPEKSQTAFEGSRSTHQEYPNTKHEPEDLGKVSESQHDNPVAEITPFSNGNAEAVVPTPSHRRQNGGEGVTARPISVGTDPESAVDAPADPGNAKSSIPVSSAQETVDQGAKVSTALHVDGGDRYTARKRTEEYFRKNRGTHYSTNEIAATLGIDLELTRSVLASLVQTKVIVNVGGVGVGSELWRYKRQPGES